MKVEDRLESILEELEKATQPIVARKFAEKFSVSRQVIVGDIALLRAAGQDILSTPKGYILNNYSTVEIKKKMVCRHSVAETADEINTIIALGGKLLDVWIEHPVYGELTGTLNIFNQADADYFNEKLKKGETTLLSELTEGVHIHTVAADSMEELAVIEKRLKEKGYLYTSH